MAEQQAKVDQMRVLAQLKQKQFDALKVRAGIDGVLVDLPLQVGQHLQPGTMLAKVVQPDHLMAALKIAETQARDVGRPAFGQENNTISLFRLDPDGKEATRVPVKVGRESVNSIQILDGLR